jgi:hypothetical protein
MNYPNHPDWLTEAEAAEVVRRMPSTMKRWRRLRVGPPTTVIRGRVLYSRESLLKWLEKQERDVEQKAVTA